MLALAATLAAACTEPAQAKNDGSFTTVGQRIPFAFAVPLPTTPTIAVGEGRFGIKASDCGACHRALYEEWKGSTHAAAMRDPQYFAELSKPGSPRWLCLSCHAPVQNQRRWLITENTRLRSDPHSVAGLQKVPNPNFDLEMQREGVTCATCHVRVDQGDAYVVAANVSGRAPHPVRADQKALHNICQRCHDPGEGRITPVFFCWFETAREAAAAGVNKSCVSCHMPPVTRSIVANGPARANRHHYWTGGGVPKTFSAYDELRKRGYEPGVSLQTKQQGTALTITLTNDTAGHHVTSADPERFIWVRTTVTDSLGRHRVIDTKRFGQRWDWGRLAPTARPARRLADNRLPAGESKSWTIVVPKHSQVTVSAAHVRLTPANVRHMKRTVVHPELLKIWPEAAESVAHLEKHYPMMTWFARRTTTDGQTWTATPLRDLLEESKQLREASLTTLEAILSGAP